MQMNSKGSESFPQNWKWEISCSVDYPRREKVRTMRSSAGSDKMNRGVMVARTKANKEERAPELAYGIYTELNNLIVDFIHYFDR